MALPPSAAAEQNCPSDHSSSSSSATPSDAIGALRTTHGSTQLAAWLDHHVVTATSNANIDSTVTTSNLDATAAALRQLSQSLSSVRDASRTELDQSITSLVSTIPKIGIELRLMSDAATALRSRVDSLQSQTSAKDTSTDLMLARIAALSKAKAGLIDARHTLREAQAWSTLESQITMLLSESRWQEAVERITKATDSLRLFSGSAKSNQERSHLLHTLTKRLQDELIPVLQQAIVDRDRDKVAQMAKLLASTHNGAPTFFQVYIKTRSQNLLSRWEQTASETSEKSLPARLTSLFGDLLALLGEERVAASLLFTDPNVAAQLLIADILVRLDPPIHACIQQATLAPDLEAFLAALTDAYKATEDAVRAVKSILPEAKARQDSQQDDDAGGAPSPIDSQLLTLDTTDKPWLQLMIEPFLPYQTRLATFETEAMQSRLQALQSSDLASTTPIATASSQALQVAKAALRRSTALTKSFATPSLLASLDGVLESASARAHMELKSDLQRLLNEVQTRIRRLHLSENTRQAALTYDERGEVLTPSDWDEFRKATEKLSACRESVDAINSLEETIAYQISELAASAKLPPVTAAGASSGHSTVDFTSPLSALATSSLNTTTLHELISKSKRLLSTASWRSSSVGPLLLPQARASVMSTASTVQAFQHDLVLSQFLPELELYASLPIWTSNKHPSIVNEYDLAMPKFSLSPTEAMARIGEAMLNLPRLFEGYADEVLLFCLDAAKGTGKEAKAADREEANPAHARHPTMAGTLSATDPTERSTMHRQAFSTTTVPSSHSPADSLTPAQEADGESDASVLSTYLHSLLTLFLTRFLTSTLPSLPRLTEIGAAQLAADLDYLSNISSVIYSESEGILRFWKKAAELSGDIGRLLVAEYVVGVGRGGVESRLDESWKVGLEEWGDDQVEALVRSEAFRSVARLRGWM
ncbi:hypothetical protein EX895_002831 [Sporisorium graminicola]|uniref:Conserved oligomeric Golgi complex subunit 7 n=1 Tax=Sporisorium graminicola TaxID=280036 RepID=A0A4U7KU87_9BASI|nr:hypothetical protein EX895_002831 [Sporisorium graminicola]TKY88121.1 hypothetical protein EX895_002831 [Sporisorium graminicola]